MRRLLTLVAGVFALVTGFRVLTDSDCNTVSFDGQGGRVATFVCFPDDSGAVPGTAAGIGVLAFAALMFWFALRPRR